MQNRNGEIELDFGDGTYPFRLGWGELQKLQEACDAGPFVILERICDKSFKIGDIRETLRLGLIGGGMEPVRALKLVREYVEERPLLENLMRAQAVLGMALIGAPEEETGKKPQAAAGKSKTASRRSGVVKSDLPTSTRQVL